MNNRATDYIIAVLIILILLAGFYYIVGLS